IADLGLAKRLRSAGEAAATGEDASLTQHGGALRGTPAYMAPEMARDPESADTRADLYSLGASAYDMLAGRPPFRGKTTVDVILKHINEAPQPIQQAAEKVPPKLAGIVMRLLAKSPEERYQSGADLVKDLEAPESEMLRKHGAPTPIPPIAEREAWIKGMGAAVVRKGLVKGYQILAVKGVGSLGVVYKARQWSMDRIVALKVLPPEMTKNQRFVEEFLVQARNTGRLNHPNLIHIHEVGKSGDVYYYSMEYLEGQRLDEMLDRGEDEEVGSAMAMANSPCEGRLKPRQAVDIASQVLAALDYGSRAGVIHREVRPNCIFVLPDGHVKLADLGLVVDEQTRFLEGENAFYVAPEQISGKRVDTRADIYSVGCCLYQCLTGDPPFEGGAPGEILRRRLAFPAPDPKRVNPQVRPELAYVVMRMMACMPSERYQTPAEAADALRAMVEIV
ncbi:MAG: serine/threonine-protein kinase, partial [Planctomycetota bacterium]|nr:serine/threonine-protein kinase [Planctomycetota bacterium]